MARVWVGLGWGGISLVLGWIWILLEIELPIGVGLTFALTLTMTLTWIVRRRRQWDGRRVDKDCAFTLAIGPVSPGMRKPIRKRTSKTMFERVKRSDRDMLSLMRERNGRS